MGKLLKIGGSIIIGLVLLGIIGIVGLISFINPNDFKGPIAKQVYHLTGRKLVIKGDINWSFFPWLGLQIHSVRLDNPADFQQPIFAQLKEADVRLKLLALFRGKFALGKITLKGLDINLIKKTNGENNWQNLSATQQANTNPQTKTQAIKPSKTQPGNSKFAIAPLAITIGTINVTNAALHYTDRQTKQNYSINKLDFQSHNVGFNKTFPIHLKFNFNTADLKGKTRLQSNIELNTKTQQLTLTPLQLNAQIKTLAPQQSTINFSIHTQGVLNLKNASFNITKFGAHLANLQLKGSVSGTHIFKRPQIQGTIDIPQFNPKLLCNALDKPLAFQSSNAFTKLSGKTNFTYINNSINLKQLHINLDQSVLTGDIVYHVSMNQTSHFNLLLNQINLSNYQLKSATKTTAPTKQPNKTSTNGNITTALPTPTLRKLNLQGSLQVGTLKVNGLTASDFDLKVNAGKGIIKMPISMALYQGKSKSNLIIDVTNNIPRFQITANLNHIKIAPLLQDYVKSNKFALTGTANLAANLMMQGTDENALMHSLNGNVNFEFNNGNLTGINVGYILQSAVALFNRQTLPPASNVQQTHFGNLSGTLQIQNGIAQNNDLLLNNAPTYKVTGRGTINLITQALNYHLSASTQNTSIARVQELQKLLGGSVPFKVTGSLTSPKAYPDANAIAQAVAKSYLNKNKAALQKKLNKQLDGLGNKVNKAIGGFL